MTTRRDLLSAAPAAGALLAFGPAALGTPVRAQTTPGTGPDRRSQSLVDAPAEGPGDDLAATLSQTPTYPY